MKIIARILSTVLHPLLMPLYGMLLVVFFSYMSFFPTSLKGFMLAIVALFTMLVPMLSIALLKFMKVISDVSLNNRADRKIPYLISLGSYLACGILLYRINVPLWLVGFIGGGLASLLIASVITIWWKISAHMTGMAGLTGCALYLSQTFSMMPFWLLPLLILFTGMLGSSRIILNRHTFGQVLAGTANGFLCVYLVMLFL
ncbi:MAG: phosphatase PAP2 family protein [Bacteroidales bacterium]